MRISSGLSVTWTHMKCPTCTVGLTRQMRQNIEFYECPNCKGLWLDRHALHAIIRRTEEDVQAAGQVHLPGSASLKHARRDEDWVDYYPEGTAEAHQSTLAEIFRA